jgi:exopolysaccharide biosynthesis polyprenyl glycosylphosphotransferase
MRLLPSPEEERVAERTVLRSDDGRRPGPAALLLSGAPSPRGGTDRLYGRLALGVALTDGAGLALAMVAARLLRFGPGLPRSFLGSALALSVAWVGLFAAFRLYHLSSLAPAEEFRRVIEAISLGIGARIAVLGLLDRRAPGAWVGYTLAFSLALVLAGRLAWHKYMGHLRSAGRLRYRALILGANEEADRIAEALSPKASGFLPVGLVRAGGEEWPRHRVPVLGELSELPRVLSECGIESVFIASSAVGPELMKRLIRQLRRHRVDVRVSANMTEILASRLTVHPVGSLLALSMQPVRLAGAKAAAKRGFDLVVGVALLALTSPLLVLAAVAVKATSRGPVLFRQRRVGRDQRLFTIYKFRTMVKDAEAMLPGLQEHNEATGLLFKMRRDPRITPVGRVLRRLSIDELPQLVNVIKGDMSVVGPRPPLPKEVAAYEDWHMDRLEVRPGITGLWQVGRSREDWSFDDCVRLDLFYIENWSITYDLFILAKTVPAVFGRGGGNV